MKRLLLISLSLLAAFIVSAQPRYDFNRMKTEDLNRGVVAFRSGNRVIVSWRVLRSDNKNEPFNVFRNGVQINKEPIAQSGSMFIDEQPLTTDAVYEVKGGGKDGKWTLKADAPDGYLPIKLDKPSSQPEYDSDRIITYSANDASVGDVDGDGQYEIFLKWDPSNSHDNAHVGMTNSTYIDCYRLDGTRLWRIDLGRNIRSGAHYIPYLIYDFDGDGRAELMVKTGDGTRDGQGNVIGDATKDWRCKEKDERYGRIMSGNEYLTVFDGLTGRALATEKYVPQMGRSEDWGDDHANRSERYLAGVAYLDGTKASALFCRGYYTRVAIAAWDWDGKRLSQRWFFDSNKAGNEQYAGQGNHNLRVADIDGDGYDEIVYGSCTIDHNGQGLYSTGLGHGDALHLTVFDPTSDRLQVWACHENRRDGSTFRDAATGKILFQIPSNTDVGRCMAADIDPDNPGLEMWSTESGGIRNIKGELITPPEKDTIGVDEGIERHWGDFKRGIKMPPMRGDDAQVRRKMPPRRDDDGTRMPQKNRQGGRGLSTNFGIWWDGDLLRELLDHEMVMKYDWKTGHVSMIKHFDGMFNNWTKSNPCLSADIIGDWREEVLIRNNESTELRLYVSDIPTTYRMNCLMQDIPYRLSVAAENVGYNQPPETGFYLGPDETVCPFLK